jgi:hypothetical protein
MPNADPTNIDLLRAKHPETAHPDRDPVRLSSKLWPSPQDLEEHWSSDAGIEFLDKWFSVAKICQYFRTRSPVTTPDIDGWHARDLIAPLFFNDNTELHNLIRRRLILPYLTGSFHSSFIEEYAGGLLMALQKPDGGIRPILCGEVWRRCFASLAVNATPIRNEAAKLFTSSYDNFIQTAGIRDGASHCAKILSVFYDSLNTSDSNDPDVIIKIDVSNAFNTTDRALTLDMISGRASWDYACGIKEGDVIPTVNTVSNLFGYFKAMRSCHSKLRYFDWDGQVHLAKGKTGGQQGDPLEMLIFNLTIHHLWGRVLAKFQEARAVAYADDGYIKAKLSVALQVLAEVKAVFKADAGLELNVSKTSIIPSKGVTAQAAFDMAQNIMQATPLHSSPQ